MEKDELIERLSGRIERYCAVEDNYDLELTFDELLIEWDAFDDSLESDECDGVLEQAKNVNSEARRLMFAMGRSAPDDIVYMVQEMLIKVADDIESAKQSEKLSHDRASALAQGFRKRVELLSKAMCPDIAN